MDDPIKTIINSALGQIGSKIGGKVYDSISNYLNSSNKPTQEGIIELLATDFGSQITTDNAVILAGKLFEARTKNGAEVNLGDGVYGGGGSAIAINGGLIKIVGNASIKAS